MGLACHFLSCTRVLINVFTPRTNRTTNKFDRNKKIELSNSLDILQFTGEGYVRSLTLKISLAYNMFFDCCCFSRGEKVLPVSRFG